MDLITEVWQGSGLYQMSGGQAAMLLICLLLLYLGIVKKFEPLLLVTIGFGGLLSNIPGVEIATGDGLLHLFYVVGITTGAFPLIIFMGVGAMTDFGPLLANPRTLFLGAAAQFGIFATLLGALGLTYLGWADFSLRDAAAIGIIGGADGPTAIYVAGKLAPDLLGAIAVAAYSYMALVPLIQPPIMKALTTEAERKIEMVQLREVSKTERVLFPIVLLLLVALVLPSAAPLIGMLAFGNLMRECGVVDRLSDTTQNALINIVTIFLGLAVGPQLSAEQSLETIRAITPACQDSIDPQQLAWLRLFEALALRDGQTMLQTASALSTEASEWSVSQRRFLFRARVLGMYLLGATEQATELLASDAPRRLFGDTLPLSLGILGAHAQAARTKRFANGSAIISD